MRNYDKYGPHEQMLGSKFEKMPKHVAESIDPETGPHTEYVYSGVDVSGIVGNFNQQENVVGDNIGKKNVKKEKSEE